MANEQNLIPLSLRTKSEQREIAAMGGLASGEARRNRKSLRETLEIFLENGDLQESIALALIYKALTGDVGAFKVIRDSIGEAPDTRIMQNLEFNTLNPEKVIEMRRLAMAYIQGEH